MKQENKFRLEVKLGFFIFVLFGLSHTVIILPKVINGFLGALSIALIMIGFLSESKYQRLKSLKKRN